MSPEPYDDDDVSPEPYSDDDMLPEVDEESARVELAPPQEVRLGYEIDRCSGELRVRDRRNRSIFVPRGRWTTIDVAIDGNGYWYWRCGTTREKSRGEPNYRQRVKRLKVWHSTYDRKITWWCYDLL
jgi:hypothetical protein